MKTIFIFNEFEIDLQFFVLEGDYSHLDGSYINTLSEDDVQEEAKRELYDIVYDDEGHHKVSMSPEFPYSATYGDWVVIQTGFVP